MLLNATPLHNTFLKIFILEKKKKKTRCKIFNASSYYIRVFSTHILRHPTLYTLFVRSLVDVLRLLLSIQWM